MPKVGLQYPEHLTTFVPVDPGNESGFLANKKRTIRRAMVIAGFSTNRRLAQGNGHTGGPEKANERSKIMTSLFDYIRG